MKFKIFHAIAQKDVRETRAKGFAAVPVSLIVNGQLNKEGYEAQRFHSINCAANKHAIGSHLYPDMSKPATPVEYGNFPEELKRFIHKHKGKPSAPKRPGKSGQLEDQSGEINHL